MSIGSLPQAEAEQRRPHERNAGRGRTLHLVDIENIAGGATVSPALVGDLQSRYLATADVGEDDQVVIACSHHAALGTWFGWEGNPRRLLGSGPDGADLRLLNVLACENVAARFGRVVIASGDGIFSLAAARLQAAGAAVTVVSRRDALSRRLRLAVRDIRFLDPPPAAGVAVPLRDAA